MTMTIEKKLRDFTFWGGAATNAAKLTPEELDQIEELWEEVDDAPTVTEINDGFWFDFASLCDWIGLTEEEVMAREKEE